MAKQIYVGVNNVARKVTNAYVGVNGVARKIKKAYVGVNDIAQLFYEAEKIIPFTSNPAPTSWSGTTTTANAVFTSSNNYGSWSVTSDQRAYNTSRITWKTFDNSGSTGFYNYTPGVLTTITMSLPTNITICPSTIYYKFAANVTGANIEGYNAETDNWDVLYTINNSGAVATENTATVSTSNYYSKFRFRMTAVKASSSRYNIYELQIRSGIIKDDR